MPAERLSSPYNLTNAPTDPRGGPSPTPALSAPARGGRGAGRARVLPGLPAALRQRRGRELAAPHDYQLLANARSGGCSRGACSCSSWRASTSAAGAMPASATTRRCCGRSLVIVLLTVVGDRGVCVRCTVTRTDTRGGGAAERRGRAVLPALPAVPVRRAHARARDLRAPSAGRVPRRRQGRAQRADRRRRRRRTAGAARDRAQPWARPAAGGLPRRRSAQARAAHRRRAGARQHRRGPAARARARPSRTK